jgi:acyl-CoA synthetase (AMP-forming)/AMP-acid ligase II
VYPQEAENVLTMHPAVVDVAVFGIPDDEMGEKVHAVVQPVAMPADDAAAAELSAELMAYCREHLAHLKCPRGVDFREELPRHPTGKLYKRLLKETKKRGQAAGLHNGTAAYANKMIKMGFKLVTISNEVGLMQVAAKAAVIEARGSKK